MNNFKKLIKNRKGISPIFATLILIAIAVIAGVVVYMFTSGTLATMTGGGTAAQEKVQVQAVQFGNSTVGVTVYAQSQSGSVTITSVIVKNSAGNVVGTSALTTANVVKSTLTTLTVLDGSPAYLDHLASGTYTVTLISSNGGNFVSPSFTL